MNYYARKSIKSNWHFLSSITARQDSVCIPKQQDGHRCRAFVSGALLEKYSEGPNSRRQLGGSFLQQSFYLLSLLQYQHLKTTKTRNRNDKFTSFPIEEVVKLPNLINNKK